MHWVRTSLVLLLYAALLLLIASGFALLRRYGAGRAAEALLLPPAFYLLYAMNMNINIGNRHILPVYPFLIVFASKIGRAFDEAFAARAGEAAKKAGAAGWRAKLMKPRTLAYACAALLIWAAAETAFIHPHYLSDFNEIAGGPSHGQEWLVDSNLDWGQDLKGLGKYLQQYKQEHPQDPAYVCYFGNVNPKYYGVEANHLPGYPMARAYEYKGPDFTQFDDIPPGALVALSATYRAGILMNDQVAPGFTRFLERARRKEPMARIGYSIFIYKW